MAEVGLVRFANVALGIASAALPLYRTTRSKHIFTQPQLLAALLLMRFEDWTFRETEVRLLEHSELRTALGLTRVPDHTALYRFMRRLRKGVIDAALTEAARQTPPAPSGGAVVAVDGTGLECGSTSTYFVQRTEGAFRRHYLKLVVSVDTRRLVITSQLARRGPRGDAHSLPYLVAGARKLGPVRLVLADAEFDSHANHAYIRNQAKAMSVIPAGRGRQGHTAHGVRAEMRDAFPKELYGERAQVETVFSTIKRKLSAKAPGRSVTTQKMQAYLLGLAFNIYRLKLWLSAFRHRQQLQVALAQTK